MCEPELCAHCISAEGCTNARREGIAESSESRVDRRAVQLMFADFSRSVTYVHAKYRIYLYLSPHREDISSQACNLAVHRIFGACRS